MSGGGRKLHLSQRRAKRLCWVMSSVYGGGVGRVPRRGVCGVGALERKGGGEGGW